jgi:hypothetical protein
MKFHISLTPAAALLVWLIIAVGSSVSAQPDPALSGKVFDVQGALIPDVVITLASADRVEQTKSNDLGAFSFGLKPPGTYKLEVSRLGFKTKTIDYFWDAVGGSQQLRIMLDVEMAGNCDSQYRVSYESERGASGGNLSVKVQDSRGSLTPVPHSAITVTKKGNARLKLSQLTDASGLANFNNLDGGEYLVKVVGRGYHNLPAESFWVGKNSQTHVTVELVAKGTIIVCQ